MSAEELQNLKSHSRIDPLFMASGAVLMINIVVTLVNFGLAPGFENLWWVVVSTALLIISFRTRQYPLKVQDRLIRLEERLRLQMLTPREWHANIVRLTEDQLIGLRFASDEEVVALAEQALADGLKRKQIKERIRHWRPDEWRV